MIQTIFVSHYGLKTYGFSHHTANEHAINLLYYFSTGYYYWMRLTHLNYSSLNIKYVSRN